MEFERNKAGIPIKKCCASCESRDDKIRMPNGKRTCILGQTEPERILKCDMWQMREKIMEMKVGDGRIKSDNYFAYLLSIRLNEIRLMDEYDKDKTKPKPRAKLLKTIHDTYIKLHGSLYE